MTLRSVRHALPFAALLLVAACGRDDAGDADTTADAAAVAEAPAADAADADAAPAADAGTASLDVASIDALVRGIGKENAMLASVAERMPGATDDMAKLQLMTEVEPSKLEGAGAEAAGMDTAEYRRRKDALFTVVGQAEMRTMLEQQFATVDTTGLDEATAAQARKNVEEMKAQLSDPYAGLDAATADAVKARLPELTALRANHIGLLFKAAEADMQCPKCSAEMEKVAHQGVEIDRCTGCHGLWFDMLEHEDLKAISGSEAIDTGSAEIGRANDGHARIRCPVCDQPMIGMVVAGQPHIAYEACTVCYGVYFDAGEFSDFREETLGESLGWLFGRQRG